MEQKKNNGTTVTGVIEAYEGKVAVESLKRAGRNKNLHGIAHEIMYCDAHNANPVNIAKGTKALLTKSQTAMRDDVVLLNSGKVVGRAQLKDTAESIGKTVKQVAKGKYQGTTLVGTKETVSAYNAQVAKQAAKGIKVTQKMKSSGISSTQTTRIASKALGKSLSTKALTSAARTSGIVGASVSGGIEVISSGIKLIDGEIDGGEFTKKVVKETTGGAASAYTGSIAGGLATTAAASALVMTTAPLWVAPAIGVGAAIAVGTGVKSLFDAVFDF